MSDDGENKSGKGPDDQCTPRTRFKLPKPEWPGTTRPPNK